MTEVSQIRKADVLTLAVCAAVGIACLGATGETGRKRAKEVVCLAHLQQWGSFFQSYIDDHDGYFNPGWAVGETELWMNALRPYYKDQWPVLLCPAATRPVESETDSGTFRAWYRDTFVPSGGRHRYVSSYGINSWTNHMTYDRGTRLKEWFWGTTQDVQSTDRVPVFGDSTWHDGYPRDTDGPLAEPFDFTWGDTGTTHEMNHFCINRHSGAVNLLFMDFSARKVGLKELWTLKWHRQFNTAGPWTKAGGVTPADWPQWMRDFKDY